MIVLSVFCLVRIIFTIRGPNILTLDITLFGLRRGLKQVDTKENLTGMFMKPVHRSTFMYCLNLLNVDCIAGSNANDRDYKSMWTLLDDTLNFQHVIDHLEV